MSRSKCNSIPNLKQTYYKSVYVRGKKSVFYKSRNGNNMGIKKEQSPSKRFLLHMIFCVLMAVFIIISLDIYTTYNRTIAIFMLAWIVSISESGTATKITNYIGNWIIKIFNKG